MIDKHTYSSADSIAAFCKDSGFATLVGSTTAGGGLHSNPLFASLHNSGLVIRFSSSLSLNNDETINREVGTSPDIEIDSSICSTYERDNEIQYIINNL